MAGNNADTSTLLFCATFLIMRQAEAHAGIAKGWGKSGGKSSGTNYGNGDYKESFEIGKDGGQNGKGGDEWGCALSRILCFTLVRQFRVFMALAA